MASFLIVGAKLVDSGQQRFADLRLVDGRIDQIAPSLTARPNETVVDAEGCWLLPGMIDVHVHFREPGLTHKGTIAAESRAAAAGGVTSIFEMPNTVPQATTVGLLEEKYRLAAANSAVNYSFYLGATNQNLDEIRRLNPTDNCGLKLFMGASTGNMLVENNSALETIFRDAPLIIAAHCESTPMISKAEGDARQKYGEEVPFSCHSEIRSAAACWESSSHAVELAQQSGARLHLLHITTAQELALLSAAPLRDKQITAEVCVPHLWFVRDDYDRLGGAIKCNPSIKTDADRAALRAALRDGTIDLIATDHAPHTWDEKQGSYFQTPSGVPSIQDSLLVALELAHQGELTLEQVVERYAHAPAQLFGVEERGFLREGYRADLTLVRPALAQKRRRNQLLSRCGWSPWEGVPFSHRIEKTWVNGQLVWDDSAEQFQAPAAGERLRFNGNRR